MEDLWDLVNAAGMPWPALQQSPGGQHCAAAGAMLFQRLHGVFRACRVKPASCAEQWTYESLVTGYHQDQELGDHVPLAISLAAFLRISSANSNISTLKLLSSSVFLRRYRIAPVEGNLPLFNRYASLITRLIRFRLTAPPDLLGVVIPMRGGFPSGKKKP